MGGTKGILKQTCEAPQKDSTRFSRLQLSSSNMPLDQGVPPCDVHIERLDPTRPLD